MRKFKILDTVTGLYSTGGCKPDWTKEGKAWNSMGQVKCPSIEPEIYK